ncbi:anaphase-promoting complex subunit Hcn1 [Quaeritorhiza haematococci]|nr:anaphase-promoting complex subunit Hcn1 [Quaeritorhiza haematococci]
MDGTVSLCEYQKVLHELQMQREVLVECIMIKCRLDQALRHIDDSGMFTCSPDADPFGNLGGGAPGRRMTRASFSGKMDMLKQLFETSMHGEPPARVDSGSKNGTDNGVSETRSNPSHESGDNMIPCDGESSARVPVARRMSQNAGKMDMLKQLFEQSFSITSIPNHSEPRATHAVTGPNSPVMNRGGEDKKAEPATGTGETVVDIGEHGEILQSQTQLGAASAVQGQIPLKSDFPVLSSSPPSAFIAPGSPPTNLVSSSNPPNLFETVDAAAEPQPAEPVHAHAQVQSGDDLEKRTPHIGSKVHDHGSLPRSSSRRSRSHLSLRRPPTVPGYTTEQHIRFNRKTPFNMEHIPNALPQGQGQGSNVEMPKYFCGARIETGVPITFGTNGPLRRPSLANVQGARGRVYVQNASLPRNMSAPLPPAHPLGLEKATTTSLTIHSPSQQVLGHNDESDVKSAGLETKPVGRHRRSESISIKSFTLAVASPQYDELGRVNGSSGGRSSVTQLTGVGIHPLSLFRVNWEMYMLVVYSFVIFILPVLVCFDSAMPPEQCLIVGLVISAVYFVDLFIHLFTLRLQPNSTKYGSLMHSQLHYIISGHFFIDLAGSIPWELTGIVADVENAELMVLLRMLRFGSMAKIMRTNPVFGRLLANGRSKFKIPEQFANLMTLFLMLLLFIHWYACAIWMMGKFTHYANEYWVMGDIVLRQDFWNQIGYEPIFWPERLVTISFIFIAGLVYAGLVGMISSISFGLNASGRIFRQKMDEVNEYLECKQVDDQTKSHVRDYMTFKYRGKYFNEKAILEEFNKHIRDMILLKQGVELVKKVPFFNRTVGDGRDKIWIQRVVSNLKPSYHLKGDYVFEQGDEAEEMYFIFQGWVEIIVDDEVVRKLEQGSFFGEVAPLGNTTRTASVRAGANCILYALKKLDLDLVLNDFPEMTEKFALVAMERLRAVTEQQRKKRAAEHMVGSGV